MSNQVEALRKALERIADIPNSYHGGEWDEIQEARNIAKSALAAPTQPAEAAPAPASWRKHVEDRLRTWKQRTMNKSGDMLALDDFMDAKSLEDLIDFVCDQWAEPAVPAVAPEPLADEQHIVDTARVFATNNEYHNGRPVSIQFTPQAVVMFARALLGDSPAPPALMDERAAFEARFTHLDRYPEVTAEVRQWMWSAWEARAALASSGGKEQR